MESEGFKTRPSLKRPQSDDKPLSAYSLFRKYNNTRSSTGNMAASDAATESVYGYSRAEAEALAQFNFFDYDDPPSTDDIHYIPQLNPGSTFSTADGPFSTDNSAFLVSSLPHYYVDTRELGLEELLHPTGSPVLERELLLDMHYFQEPADEDAFLLDQGSGTYSGTNVVQFIDGKRSCDHSENHLVSPNQRRSTVQDSVYSDQEEPIVSVAKRVGGFSLTEECFKPKIIEINKAPFKSNHISTERRQTSEGSEGAKATHKEESSNAQSFGVRRDSAPIGTNLVPDPSTAMLEETRIWLTKLADEEADNFSDESTKGLSHPSAGSSSIDKKSRSNVSHYSSVSPKKSSNNIRKQPTRPANPGPSRRPKSPPLHGKVVEPRRPIEQKDREHWTLYNISCWTNKTYLRTLLKGPVFDFRTKPSALPYIENVSQEMLKHFCGEEHLLRLIRNYSLPPEAEKQNHEEKPSLVFSERLINPTAVMRIIRYMRRCCLPTTTMMKPQFQLHAPPSLEASIETVRACNIFGLYADARRLQYFLTDSKIPGGSVTMDDIETIWEGYDGELRDSVYTDALMTHVVYNVLGSDSADREDLMVLLEQPEYVELREQIGYELGVKKKKAEEKETFMKRKQMEREEKINRAKGMGKPLSKLEEFYAKRGPMVQGRLLRVLGYDAFAEADPTTETRYKRRPGLGRKPVPTPDLLDHADEEGLESRGRLYPNTLRQATEYGPSMSTREKIDRVVEEVSAQARRRY